jgi:hypothetical protein
MVVEGLKMTKIGRNMLPMCYHLLQICTIKVVKMLFICFIKYSIIPELAVQIFTHDSNNSNFVATDLQD